MKKLESTLKSRRGIVAVALLVPLAACGAGESHEGSWRRISWAKSIASRAPHSPRFASGNGTDHGHRSDPNAHQADGQTSARGGKSGSTVQHWAVRRS